ncbi:GrdX family protein [Clostridium sp. JN-1]|uniref:GrdX family protein n=1 Tax=Clostridium sp. JN-1 TaxID=2483110 RepID=UPI000F0B4672|nr:GrdX family protein [Clostridium sp. JN-1]
MIEPVIIVTNNPLSRDRFQTKHKVYFINGNVMDVLKMVRDYVHCGHKLLTHPLVGSVKPNQIPYRTILLSSDKKENVDFQSLGYIEKSIYTTQKFIKNYDIPMWDSSVLNDFSVIDYDIIKHVFE